MTYNEFKEYLARFVWRDGDAPFEAELDNLIKMGTARLNRDLRISRMVKAADLSVVDDAAPLPEDYLELRVVTSRFHPSAMMYVTPHEYDRLKTPSRSRMGSIYTILGRELRFLGAEFAAGLPQVTISYYAKLPDFAAEDTSWLAEEFLDLYTYAVLRHTASYLRDDERVALWQNEYMETLASVKEAAYNEKYAGSPLTVRLPGQVA